MYKIKSKQDKAVLIGVNLKSGNIENKKSSLKELALLVETAGIEVVDSFVQNREAIDKTTYAGKGFLEGIRNRYQEVDIYIFDNELSPTQSRNIEKLLEVIAIDRTEVILTIFHQHAHTKEARLQVELAELKYQLPRLKKLWSHLDRERGQASGSRGVARGMGEKQIEIDRRRVIHEISRVQKMLKKIVKQRHTQRKKAQNEKRVCLVGYTNAGKSTLFNRMTDANTFVEDKLFATLDSTARRLPGEFGHDLIISDTVGFISNLPHNLVASFRSTLLDVKEADLLLHVVDVANERFRDQIKAVEQVLREIGANESRILMVMNKVDLISNEEKRILKEEFSEAVQISANTGYNISKLTRILNDVLKQPEIFELYIPVQDQQEINQVHELGKVISQSYHEEGVLIRTLLSENDIRYFEKYRVNIKGDDHED